MQQTTIIGHIGNDAILNNVNGTESVINFNVAVTERYQTKDGEKKESTTWFSCSYWNRPNLAPHLLKGTLVHIAGKVTADVWIDANKEAKPRLRLKVDRLDLLGSKKEASVEGAPAAPADATPAAGASEPAPF